MDIRTTTIGDVARALITLAIVGHAAFTLTVVSARLFALSFVTVVIVGSLIWGTVVLAGVWWAWTRRSELARINRGHVLCLAAMMGVSGALACAINAPEEDDSYYVPAALHALAVPTRPLGFDYEWTVPFNSTVKLRSDLGLIANNVEFFWAFVSRLTGADYLALYQVAGSLVFGAAFPLVYFRLVSRFSSSSAAALFGTWVVTLAAFVLFRENGIGFGIFLNKIWIGKAILLVLMIPVVAGFAFELMASPSLARWGLLCASVVAAAGCSSSSFFLMPILLLVLTPAALWYAYSSSGFGVRRWLTAAAISSAAFYPLGLASFFYFRYRHRISHLEGLTITSNLDIFNSGFVPYIGHGLSLTALIFLGSAAFLFCRQRPDDRLFLVWSVSLFGLFLNPLASGIVARNLTTITNYNRLFHLLPVFAVTGVAAARLAEWFPGTLRMGLLSLTVLELVAWRAVQVDPLALQLDVPKLRVLGTPHFGAPFLRMDPDLVADVREVARLTPAGNTLATVDYELAMTMLTTEYPQYGLWPIDVIRFYGETQGFPEEAALRHGAARFMIGQTQFRGDLERLLDTPVRNVIVSRRMGNDISDIQTAVRGHGFGMIIDTRRYVAYTRSVVK